MGRSCNSRVLTELSCHLRSRHTLWRVQAVQLVECLINGLLGGGDNACQVSQGAGKGRAANLHGVNNGWQQGRTHGARKVS